MVKLTRYDRNPILAAIPEHQWESKHVSNAGATVKDGKVHILYRAEGEDTRPSTYHTWPVSRMGLAISSDGFTIDERLPEPVIDITGEQHPHTDGVEDARIACIDGLYHAVYCTTSIFPECLALATSPDLIHWDKHGTLMPEYSQRTAGLLPEKIDGEYVLFYRVLPHMWVARSHDLKTWHDHKIVLRTRYGHWTEVKMGIGGTPIKTDQAWVTFIHGKDRNAVYRLGVCWLDLEDPSKVLKVQEEPVLEPQEPYELEGFVGNAVYTCGAAVLGGECFVYYGCADTCLAVATVAMKTLRL
jgi:beta-1,2-mannobiose phosphorylase / 1,2-beta-oligomannan phosphorylase